MQIPRKNREVFPVVISEYLTGMEEVILIYYSLVFSNIRICIDPLIGKTDD
jgi:hypothetical protein